MSRNGFSSSAEAPGRHHHHDCVGRDLARTFEKLETVHTRHPNIGEHDIDVLAAEQIAGGHAVLGQQDVEAVPLKQDTHPLAHRLLIVHDEDARRFVPRARHLGAR